LTIGAVPLVAFAAAPAGAGVYPPGTCRLALSVSVAERGQTVLASTVNCTSPYQANVTVNLTLLSDPIFLTSTVSNSGGQFRNVPFVIPQQAELGQHTVRSTGQGADVSNLVLNAPITVVGPGGGGGGGQGVTGNPTTQQGARGGLAFTGSDAFGLLLLALVLLTIGTTLVLAARRRAEVQRRSAAT
jgi:hypothetical protein